MHIPDGFLAPPVLLATGLASLAGVGYSLYRLRGALEDRLTPMIGVMAAGIFAGQMVNFPLPLLPVSGHLMGGVLAAVVLGPWGAVIALANVLIVQCFLYADGGPLSLGANLFNMGLIGGALGYAVYDPLRRWIGGPRGTVIAAVLASWLIIPVSALAFAAEFTLGADGAQYPFWTIAEAMLFYHALIGVGEAAITGMVTAWIVRVRPDLIYGGIDGQRAPSLAGAGQAVLGGLAVAASVAVFLAPFASGYGDGLEHVAGQLDFEEFALPGLPAPFPDYELPAIAAGDAEGSQPTDPTLWQSLATRGIGLLGTIVTFVLALGLAQTVRIARPETA